jgi:hypothetical protein
MPLRELSFNLKLSIPKNNKIPKKTIRALEIKNSER